MVTGKPANTREPKFDLAKVSVSKKIFFSFLQLKPFKKYNYFPFSGPR